MRSILFIEHSLSTNSLKLSIGQRFLRFYWQAQTKYTIHSPFVFSLIEEVIEDHRIYYDFNALNRLRMLLERDHSTLQVSDLGAGSRIDKTASRSISSITKNAVSPTWQCELLFRLVHHLQAKNRLELGTSLGISSLYQYIPLRKAPFYTLEGCPNIAKVATANFKKLKATSIRQLIGDFNQTLPKALQEMKRLDYVFIDGNHQMEPTLSYFETCLKYSHNDTVFVFDDIYWSDEMQDAWETIKAHSKVTLSIDLFFMGIVFLRTEQKEVQHFKIVPAKYKPWKMGFFAPSKS